MGINITNRNPIEWFFGELLWSIQYFHKHQKEEEEANERIMKVMKQEELEKENKLRGIQ